jgi:hypothetical protein
MKAAGEQALMIGWHARNLHYVDKLKPLGHYLTPPPPPAQKRDTDAQAVLAMFKRHAKKKGT